MNCSRSKLRYGISFKMATVFVTAILFSTIAMCGRAEAYPDRPITMIVPYAAGGTADLFGRLFAQYMSDALGQQVIVEMKAGAGSMIGAQFVANAKPDGYTILLGANSLTINAAIMKLTFDPLQDLLPVAGLIGVPSVLVTSAASELRTLQDVISASKHGHLTFGSSGPGTVSQMCGEFIKERANIELEHIPYKGSGAVYSDLIAGRVSLLCDVSGSALGFIKSGSVRALGVTSKERLKSLPDVPTIAEQGFPGFEVLAWFGLFVPSGTPPQIVARLATAAVKVSHIQAFDDKVGQWGGVPLAKQSSVDFSHFYKAEAERYKSMVRKGTLKRLE
ncbi:MAG: tripartite tricarboxylate transporter substrate binding protein [Casimicrobiaceae bacterium]